MSAVITFVPEEMADFAADADGWAVALREEARDLGAALERFRAGSSEYVPALPDHAARIDHLSQRTASLAEAVGTLAAAADQADREGLRLEDILLTVGGGISSADKVVGGTEALVNLTRFSLYSLRAAGSRRVLSAFNRRWGSRAMPDIGAVRRSTPGGPALPRRQARQIQLQTYREIKGPRAAARAAYDNARRGLRRRMPVTDLGGRVSHFVDTTRVGSAVRVSGRVLGGAGTVLSGIDAYQAWQEGDTEQMVTSGLSTVGGVLLLSSNPVGIALGATLVVGTLIYENRVAMGNAFDSVIDGAGRVLGELF